jgi:antitoxin HicB
MSVKKNSKRTDHSGSTFDSFLEEEGIREEVEAVAIKRVRAWQLAVELRSTGQPRAAVLTKARKH